MRNCLCMPRLMELRPRGSEPELSSPPLQPHTGRVLIIMVRVVVKSPSPARSHVENCRSLPVKGLFVNVQQHAYFKLLAICAVDFMLLV